MDNKEIKKPSKIKKLISGLLAASTIVGAAGDITQAEAASKNVNLYTGNTPNVQTQVRSCDRSRAKCDITGYNKCMKNNTFTITPEQAAKISEWMEAQQIKNAILMQNSRENDFTRSLRVPKSKLNQPSKNNNCNSNVKINNSHISGDVSIGECR